MELLQKEIDHLGKALSNCKHPKWAMEGLERRFLWLTSKGSSNANNQDTARTKPTTTEPKTQGHIAIP